MVKRHNRDEHRPCGTHTQVLKVTGAPIEISLHTEVEHRRSIERVRDAAGEEKRREAMWRYPDKV